MLKRYFVLCMILIMGATIFAGCSSSTSTNAGDVYVGKWSGPLPKDHSAGFKKIEISRNGDSYLVKVYSEINGKIVAPSESGASLTQDGILDIHGMGTITHIKADDTLKPNWLNVTLLRENKK